MRQRILELEAEARKLEPDTNARKAIDAPVMRYADDFLTGIESIPAYVQTPDKGKALLDSPIEEAGTSIEEIIQLLAKNVDRPGLNPASGGHLGYIPGGGIYPSALGDYLAAVFNRYAGVFFGSPGAVRMENMLIDWMANVIGYSEGYAGNLASGGSISNLIAMVCARDAKGLKGKDLEASVIYASAHVHHSINKAINIAGLRECVLRTIPTDSRNRLSTEALETQITLDKAIGLRPFLVVGNAGSTDTGSIDPLEEIAMIAAAHDLWYHVDAAYGGFFMLCETLRHKFKGIERADSVVIDPHKGLFLPYGLGVVLVKNKQDLLNSHQLFANYMQDAFTAPEELSPAELSPELTKHFRGLRLWLPLKLLGVKPFRACLLEKHMLALYFHEHMRELPGWEVGPLPDLSVVTFRYVPQQGDANAFNKALVEAIHADGRVFLSSTTIDGIFTLRLAVLSFRSHLRTIDLTIALLEQLVERLMKSSSSSQ